MPAMPAMPDAIAAAANAWRLAPLLLGASLAHGARPMATDDAATSAAGVCQIEAWSARDDAGRALALAPACGLTDELELGAGIARSNGAGAGIDNLGLGLKWAPEAASWDTALGTLRLGLSAGTSWSRERDRSWHGDGTALAGLASWQFTSAIALHLNAHGTRARSPSRWTHGWAAALAWQAHERALLFGETLHAEEAHPVRNAGVRWWLLPEVLGLDLVLTRAGGSWSAGLGFGWYGLFGR